MYAQRHLATDFQKIAVTKVTYDFFSQ